MHIVSSSVHFRKLARTLPSKADTVMEIGASCGVATAVLAKSSGRVFAVEHSKKLAQDLETKFADSENVTALWHDARDIHGLLEKVPHIDVLFFDVGGDAPVDVAVYMLQHFMSAYRPRIAVVRNMALAGMLGQVESCEAPSPPQLARYCSLPSKEEILSHYARENRRSGSKFVDRERNRQRALELGFHD